MPTRRDIITTLTQEQARKLILHAQGLSTATATSKGRGKGAALSVIERLGYVQIDTIAVVQRAHHHVLWSRLPHYQPQHLDALIASKDVFEYWSHAAAYLPMSAFRYSLPRKAAIKAGLQRHWHQKDKALMHEVRARIEAEGPLMAKDFESDGIKRAGWGGKRAKQALENLFMDGDLMIVGRRNFHKVYELTERVLPADVNTSMPSDEEYGAYLVETVLGAQGLACLSEIAYLLKGVKPLVAKTLQAWEEAGKVVKVTVSGDVYYALPDSLALLNKRLNRSRAKILSPFDNLLIQRNRAKTFFNFDYLIECYTPAAKRQYGYFCLPVLWDGKLVARADCKVDKNSATLHVLNLFLEPSLTATEPFLDAFEAEVCRYAAFNQCSQYQIHQVRR